MKSANLNTNKGTKFINTIESVISRDGTVINYRRLGAGAGIVLLHGFLESPRDLMPLAKHLAAEFTVYLPRRRSHHAGGSKIYSMFKEVEDLNALLIKTGSHFVFGSHSSALICLKAALWLPNIQKIAVYEPAMIINDSISIDFSARYDQQIARGDIAGALVTAMNGSQIQPFFLNFIPRWVRKPLIKNKMKNEAKTAKPGDTTLSMLAPTLHYDFRLLAEMAETQHTLNKIEADVLLLGGTKSPRWLRSALERIENELQSQYRIAFAGLDHRGYHDPGTKNQTRDPKRVAGALLHFFKL